jgi:hypothetical protein
MGEGLERARTSEMRPVDGAPPREVDVRLRRTRFKDTEDQPLWTAIRLSTGRISFANYDRFMDIVMCGESPTGRDAVLRPYGARSKRATLRLARALPFPDIEPYRLLKVATEVFLTLHCGVSFDLSEDAAATTGHYLTSREDLTESGAIRSDTSDTNPLLMGVKIGSGLGGPEDRTKLKGGGDRKDLKDEQERYYRLLSVGDIETAWGEYLSKLPADEQTGKAVFTLPYLEFIRRKLKDVAIVEPKGDGDWIETCSGIIHEKLTKPCFLELIWSYWHEEGMLVQTMNAIGQRFQNVRGARGNPLAQIEIDPLRPLNNLLWGYLQEEQHRLTVRRRVYEYDHHYGLSLYGLAVPEFAPADSRSKFLEAFHNLLQICGAFFKQDDDTTVVADGFPVLNALRDVHLILSEGAHNQYGDLPWTARMEMLMQQWLLARPEFREFLPTRIMVDYPEPWMDRVDAMKKLQGWTDVSVLHFRNLGMFGEQILLAIRFGAWSDVNDPVQAANWARYWRAEIQGYIHAYRAVTGVDITDTSETTARLRYVMPSVHLRNRLASQAGALPSAQPVSLPAARPRALPTAAKSLAPKPAGTSEQ